MAERGVIASFIKRCLPYLALFGLPVTHKPATTPDGPTQAKHRGEDDAEFIVRASRVPHVYISKPDAASSTFAHKHRLRSAKNIRTILVVDDNEAAAQSIAKLLQLRGHVVSIAYNGLDAIEKARQQRPDIVILDIGLPDIDGYEVVRILRSDDSFSSAIIALTGYGQEGDKERALQAGFHHHLTKPVGLKELERAFKKVSAA